MKAETYHWVSIHQNCLSFYIVKDPITVRKHSTTGGSSTMNSRTGHPRELLQLFPCGKVLFPKVQKYRLKGLSKKYVSILCKCTSPWKPFAIITHKQVDSIISANHLWVDMASTCTSSCPNYNFGRASRITYSNQYVFSSVLAHTHGTRVINVTGWNGIQKLWWTFCWSFCGHYLIN